MKDIAILEQQQRDAQRKLQNAQITKQSKLDQQKHLNENLEMKKYSNGALRAKLQQWRDFLSSATRELGGCELRRDRCADEIEDFGKKLNKGIRMADRIKISCAMIDSLSNLIEHKTSKIVRLKRGMVDGTKEARAKYEQIEKEDRMLRSSIQVAHRKAREWTEEKVSLCAEISKLDRDKVTAQNTEQSTELRIQSAFDQIKSEEDRASQLKLTQVTEMEEIAEQKKNIQSEIDSISNTIQISKVDLQAQKKKIIEQQKKEEGPPISYLTDDEDNVPLVDQSFVRAHMKKFETEAKEEDGELESLNHSIKEIKRALQDLTDNTITNEKVAAKLESSINSMNEEEDKRGIDAEKFQETLKLSRFDLSKLKESFIEMKESREAETQSYSKKMKDCDDEILEHSELIEELKLKIKVEDTSLKTKIRLFKEELKPKLLEVLNETEDGSRRANKKYQELVEMSTDTSIGLKLETKFKFEERLNDDEARWEAKNRNLIARRDKILEGKFLFLHM